MLLVNSNSNLKTADAFVKKIKSATCVSTDIRSLFSANGNELRIEKNHKGARPPGWFKHWHDAAVVACERDEWELTTGFGFCTSGGAYVLIPDGVSTRSQNKDPTGRVVPDHEISWDTGVWGAIVPTETMARELSADNDKLKHYDGSVVWAKSPGRTRGAIVVVDRYQLGSGGKTETVSSNEFTKAFFHELLHAGRISGGAPYADDDARFSGVANHIQAQFQKCSAAQ